MGRKISIQELAAIIAERTGNTKKLSEDFLRVFQSTIEEGLEKDGLVKIKGLGTFKLVWNEPRRSVNVQTGQEYVIPGHNKVSFLPDSLVKEIVNSSESAEKFGIDPLKKLNDQAEEIKDILADLQKSTPPKKTKQTVTHAVVTEEKETEEKTVIEEKESLPVATTAETSEKRSLVEEVELLKETPTKREIPVKKGGKRIRAKREKRWIKPFLISIFVVLLVGAISFAIWYLNLIPVVSEKFFALFDKKVEFVDIPTTEIRTSDTTYVSPAIEVKKKEAVEDKKEAVSPTSIFEQPRVYNSFIGTETLAKGKTLTLIALEYYGHKNFWVYIYEANKDRIANPNSIPQGFTIKIPKLPDALIDENNPECVKYAGELEKKYTGRL
jgi:nucleoid DNA-binding protein